MKVYYAEKLDGAPPWLHQGKAKGVQQKGLLFERRVGTLFTGLFPERVECGPWFKYGKYRRKQAWCQPDILVWLSPSDLMVLECKLTATKSAKKQLLSLYKPVLQTVYPNTTIRCVQVCNNLKRSNSQDNFNLMELQDIFDATPKWDAATVQLKRLSRTGLDLSQWTT